MDCNHHMCTDTNDNIKNKKVKNIIDLFFY